MLFENTFYYLIIILFLFYGIPILALVFGKYIALLNYKYYVWWRSNIFGWDEQYSHRPYIWMMDENIRIRREKQGKKLIFISMMLGSISFLEVLLLSPSLMNIYVHIFTLIVISLLEMIGLFLYISSKYDEFINKIGSKREG